jgi:hypothetical protein
MGTDLMTHGVDQTSRVHWDGRTLTVIKRGPWPAPVEEWTATDAAGHVHAYGDAENPFPTLTRVSDGWADPCETCDCGDIERYHLACAQCGEQMWPSPAGPPAELGSAFYYWIDGEPVTRPEARQFTDLIRAGDPDRWDRLRYWIKYSAGLPVSPKRARRG